MAFFAAAPFLERTDLASPPRSPRRPSHDNSSGPFSPPFRSPKSSSSTSIYSNSTASTTRGGAAASSLFFRHHGGASTRSVMSSRLEPLPTPTIEKVEESGSCPKVSCHDDKEGEEWFETSRPVGRMTSLRKDHKLSGEELPVWAGYGHASLDWDALFTFTILDKLGDNYLSPTPRKVLDVGCGMGLHWGLHLLQQPGWEKTELTAFDIAPVALPPSLLPKDVESRITIVRGDALKNLPFEPGSFDLIRCSCLLENFPEHLFQMSAITLGDLLCPGGTLEVFQSEHTIFPYPPAHDTIRFIPSSSHQLIEQAFKHAFDTRFINFFPHTLIPATVSLAVATPQDIFETMEVDLAGKDVESRVLLRAFAEKIDAAGGRLARELWSLWGGEEKGKRRLAMELEGAIDEWAKELVEVAALGKCIGELWGWRCVMDERMVGLLEMEVLPTLEDRLRACEETVVVDLGEEHAVEKLKTQATFSKRAAEAELTAARKRLAYEGEGVCDDLGSVRIAGWRASKRV